MNNRKRRGRGEGGVRYDGARKLWVGSISLGFHADGRRNRPVVYRKSKREAIEALDKLRAEAGTLTHPDALRLSVGGLLDHWLEAKQSQIAELTHEGRVEAASRVRAMLGDVLVRKLTPLRLSQFYGEMRRAGLAPSARWHAGRALAWALSYAVGLQIIPSSPADLAPVPPLKHKEMITLSQTQASALLQASRGMIGHPLISVALGTGMRQGELLGLSWSDVDLDAATLTVRRALTHSKAGGFKLKEPKTKASRRTLSLPAFAADALREYRQSRSGTPLLSFTVFCSVNGCHRHRGQVGDYLKRAVKRANASGADLPLSFRFHDLRHTHASLLLGRGHSVKAVSARLGHASATTTLRIYAHCLPGDDERLAAGIEDVLG